jgi:hypothetical protein
MFENTSQTGEHRMETNYTEFRELASARSQSKSRDIVSGRKEFKLQELAMLTISPVLRGIHHWWLKRAEDHYLICADVEQARAREAHQNVAYYQKQAALARSARH